MPETAPPKIVYITSAGHSGSTLLDVLISSHSRAVSVGEVMRLECSPRSKCSCAAKWLADCPFWQAVDASLRRDCDLTLSALDLRSDDPATWELHNSALFRAVQRVSGKDIIVDSSKTVPRLEKLLHSREFDVVPIHLVRRPQGVVYSHLKKGRPWLQYAWSYARTVRRARRLLNGSDHLAVRYEQLARDPVGVLTPIMQRLGFEFEPQQLDWAGRERHNFGGNRMRRSTDSSIRPDEAWRTGLTRTQKLVIGLATLPTRLALRRL